MSGAAGKVLLLLLVVLSTYLWLGYVITDMTGGEKRGGGVVEVSPEGGEAIFWGKGRCYTCHSLGGQGSAVRCPNLGQFGEKFALPIGARAVERALERSEETGDHYTALDYLIESLAKPDAYLVEGYKNEMAIVYAPPISLNMLEIKAVLSYLMSQGGDLDMEAIENPGALAAVYYQRIAAASAAGGGDPGWGEEVFADNCLDCHMLNGEGENIGPDLTGIAGKGLKFIAESITTPTKSITEGYETWEVTRKDGRKFIGIKLREDATEVELIRDTGEVVFIAKADIQEMLQDESRSLMPDDLNEVLTIKDFQDVQAYLMMQKEQ